MAPKTLRVPAPFRVGSSSKAKRVVREATAPCMRSVSYTHLDVYKRQAVGNGHDVGTKTLILAAFPELYGILTVAITFLVTGLMK